MYNINSLVSFFFTLLILYSSDSLFIFLSLYNLGCLLLTHLSLHPLVFLMFTIHSLLFFFSFFSFTIINLTVLYPFILLALYLTFLLSYSFVLFTLFFLCFLFILSTLPVFFSSLYFHPPLLKSKFFQLVLRVRSHKIVVLEIHM